MYAFGILTLLLYSGVCFNLHKTQPKTNNIIIFNKKNIEFKSNQDNKLLDEILSDKKIITISPGGLRGFYLMGLLTYIKENYDLENYLFSGASAGSWVSLFMSYKKTDSIFIKKIIHNDKIKNQKLNLIQKNMKNEILENFDTNDFDLDKIFIGITSINLFGLKTKIYSNFINLEDAINCCIASSHIPYITNGLFNFYNNQLCFDGGLSIYPYINNKKKSYHFHLSLFNKNHIDYKNLNVKIKNQNIFSLFKSIKELILTTNKDNEELFIEGYYDGLKNKDYFDKFFRSIDITNEGN